MKEINLLDEFTAGMSRASDRVLSEGIYALLGDDYDEDQLELVMYQGSIDVKVIYRGIVIGELVHTQDGSNFTVEFRRYEPTK